MIYFCQDIDGYVMVKTSGTSRACAHLVPSRLDFEESRRLAMYLNGCLDFDRGRTEAFVAYLKEFLPEAEAEYTYLDNGVAKTRSMPPAPDGYWDYVSALAA